MAGGRTSAKKIDLVERRRKAVSLRKTGASYRAIAAKLAAEYGEKYTEQVVFKDVDHVLREALEYSTHDANELRTLELERYDQWLLSLAEKIRIGDTKAISTAIQISDRRCKLLGLDAPIQVKIEEGVESELRSFLEGLGAVLDRETFRKVLDAYETIQVMAGSAAKN